MARSKVAVIKTTPETVISDYDRLLYLAGVTSALAKGKTTILKDNISWHLFFPGANTTPWQLEGVAAGLRTRGYEDLVVVENETVVTRAAKGEEENRFLPVFRKLGLPVKYNFRDSDMRWETYRPKARMRVLDGIFPEGIRIPDYFHGRNVVHLPTVKTHIYTTTTCSMKNAFGGLLSTRRHYTHSVIHETLVDLLAIQKEIHSGIFAVADGTTFGSGPGPRTMIPVRKDLILASADCVALDAVASWLCGFDPMKLDYIRLAHEDGLGTGRMEEIDVVGGVDIERERERFEVGDNLASHAGDLIWFGPLKRLQHLFFHTPLVNAFIVGSFVYHDYVWYPTIGRSRVREWMSTPWGDLFRKYV
ncbi:MAG: DUF362 domain-containing protein [Deltaproteobacteria bacterium]|nr:DUF362 domain-containing protein [Deltaproteobacteria bacterium]